MQSDYRLRKNGQFQYVYRKGRSAACPAFVLLHVRSQRLMVGFSISRKVGNAVVRNRVRRRLREQMRARLPRLKQGMYVLSCRAAAAHLTSSELGLALDQLLTRLDLSKSS